MADYMDLNGSQFKDEMIRELPERYTFMDGMETVIEQNMFAYGAYRPHRFLPSLYVSLQDQEGRVLHHGQVVSAVNLKAGDGTWETDAGLDSTGYFYHAQGFSGAIAGSVKDLYGYDRTLDGVLVPTNASGGAIIDHVTQGDVDIKRVLDDGTLAAAADVNTKQAVSRAANMRPIGVVASQIMRETTGANLSYRMATAAYSIVRFGVLRIPYVIAGAARIAAPSKQPSGGDAKYQAVYWRHQFLLANSAADLASEAPVQIDGNGKFIVGNGSYTTNMGRIISWTNDTYTELRTKVDNMPDRGLNVPGTMTGGLDRRLFDFVYRIRAANGDSTAIPDIVADVQAGNYGMVKIMFNTTV